MKKIVIYGATGDTGSAITKKLYDQGYLLHLVAREQEKLETMASIYKTGFTAGDVCHEQTHLQVAEDVGKECDGIIYTPGSLNLAPLRTTKSQDMLHAFQINALGAALAVQSLLKPLKKSSNNPSIVFFTSVAAQRGFANHTSIGMAKGALSSLTLTLAAELAPRVRVNAIAPSLCDTKLATPLTSNEALKEGIAKMHPLKRLGSPQDLADAASFLVSNESSWITGQIIGVDGGRFNCA